MGWQLFKLNACRTTVILVRLQVCLMLKSDFTVNIVRIRTHMLWSHTSCLFIFVILYAVYGRPNVLHFNKFSINKLTKSVFNLDECGGQSHSSSVMLSFSLLNNSRSLFSTTDPRHSLVFLGGIRFFLMVWVFLGHHTLLHFLIPAVNWIVLYKVMKLPYL